MLDPFEGRELKICYSKPISDQNKKQIKNDRGWEMN